MINSVMLHIALKLEPAPFLVLLCAALIYIGWRGEKDGRRTVAAIAIGSLATAFAADSGPVWAHTQMGVLAVDVATLLAFIMIMAFSNRFWPLWITAFQIVAVVTHVARIVEPTTIPMAYAVAEQLWAYLMLAIIVGATVRNRLMT